jgi:murein L,D-transpeptidase YafK
MNSRRALLTAGLAAATTVLLARRAEAVSDVLPMADRVVVVKSERRLYLMRAGVPFRTFRVWLGLDPKGHKEQEGDFRTPEGEYRLDAKNPQSEYFLSIHVSYPNREDMDRARRSHREPGGAIMIHGLPNVPKRSTEYYLRNDWTNGCIALTNDDMLEVWLLTRVDTPIEIRP